MSIEQIKDRLIHSIENMNSFKKKMQEEEFESVKKRYKQHVEFCQRDVEFWLKALENEIIYNLSCER